MAVLKVSTLFGQHTYKVHFLAGVGTTDPTAGSNTTGEAGSASVLSVSSVTLVVMCLTAILKL